MNRMLILMTFACCFWSAGCSQAPARGRERQPLPFVVKLKKAEVDSAEKVIASNPQVSVPMNYGDAEEFTRELARLLRESGTFEVVVTDDDQDVDGLVPDLEMEVSVRGNDFGPGKPKMAMSFFSTVTWLFAGHLAWLIRDREYPNSEVKLSVVIRKPSQDAGGPSESRQESLFTDTINLDGLDLSFSERAQRKNWLLNVIVPPFWGDGDPQAAGTSLARRSIDYFVNQVSGRITSRLPSGYFDKQSSFLHYDRQRGEILVVSQVQVVRLDILPSEGNRRALSRDDLAAFGVKAEDRESVESRLGTEVEGFGIGTGPNYFYYRIPVKEESWECARITATPENTSPCAWTVYRDAGKAGTAAKSQS